MIRLKYPLRVVLLKIGVTVFFIVGGGDDGVSCVI